MKEKRACCDLDTELQREATRPQTDGLLLAKNGLVKVNKLDVSVGRGAFRGALWRVVRSVHNTWLVAARKAPLTLSSYATDGAMSSTEPRSREYL